MLSIWQAGSKFCIRLSSLKGIRILSWKFQRHFKVKKLFRKKINTSDLDGILQWQSPLRGMSEVPLGTFVTSLPGTEFKTTDLGKWRKGRGVVGSNLSGGVSHRNLTQYRGSHNTSDQPAPQRPHVPSSGCLRIGSSVHFSAFPGFPLRKAIQGRGRQLDLPFSKVIFRIRLTLVSKQIWDFWHPLTTWHIYYISCFAVSFFLSQLCFPYVFATFFLQG